MAPIIRRLLCLSIIVLFTNIHYAQEQPVPAETTGEAPDYTWLLTSPYRQLLSAAGENMLLKLTGQGVQTTPQPQGKPVTTTNSIAPPNVLVNDPGTDTGPNTTQSETSLAISDATGTIVAGWNDSGEFPLNGNFTGYGRSTDGGATWTDLGAISPIPGGAHFGDPSIAVHQATGEFFFATLGVDASGRSIIGVGKSIDDGLTFLPQVDASPGSNPNNFQDKEIMAIDNTGGAFDGNIYVAWTEFSASGLQIMLSRSTDGGASFSTPVGLNLRNNGTSGAYPIVAPNGDLFVFWENFNIPGIEFVKSTDGGVTFTTPATITTLVPTGEPIPSTNCGRPALNGDIRTQDFPRAAIDYSGGPHHGNIYVVYNAKPAPDDESDIFFIRSTDNGATWSSPIRVNDDTTSNGNFFPEIAVNDRGIISVSWYDRRSSPSNLEIQYMRGISTDGGVSFTPNQPITDLPDPGFPPAVNFDPVIALCYMGEYNWVVTDGSDFLYLWGDNRNLVGTRHDPDVFFARFEGQDSIPPATVTDLAVLDVGSSTITLTWTATGDDSLTGTAAAYDIRYSTAGPINETNFDLATPVSNPPPPQASGTTEIFTVEGLDFNTTYFFALKVIDDFGQTSGVSNSPSGTTLGVPDIAVAPDSLSDSLLTGLTSTHMLAISNVGDDPSTLDFFIPGFAAAALLAQPGIVHNDVSNPFGHLELPKGEPDPREGHPVVLGAGGPDEFGYSWIDSDEPGGPIFDWIDITGTGFDTGIHSDDQAVVVNLGFPFTFYGNTYDQVMIGENGEVSFINYGFSNFFNQPIPDPADPNNLIAVFWDDHFTPGGGTIYYETQGTAPNRKFIVEWYQVPHISDPNSVFTYELILFEGSNAILFQYLDMTGALGNGSSATIGIEDSLGAVGLQVAFNTGYVHNGLAVSIAVVPEFLSVSPTSGTVPFGQSVDVHVTFDATGLLGGDYDDEIRILSNDPDEPEVIVPAHLHVTGAPDIAVSPDTLDFGEVFVGFPDSLPLVIRNVGTDLLTVTNITSDNPDYTVNMTNFSLNPGEAQEVQVFFTPPVTGPSVGTLSIFSDDPGDPVVTVALQGEGILPPDISIAPTSFTFNLFTGETDSAVLTITNSGGSPLTFSIRDEGTAGGSLQKLFWTEVLDIFPDTLQRSNLDGSNIETLFTNTFLMAGITVDQTRGKIYFADFDEGTIRSSDLDGSNNQILVSGLSGPVDIALDVAGGKMYWTDFNEGSIRRANLDGSGVEIIISGVATVPGTAPGPMEPAPSERHLASPVTGSSLLQNPWGIALDLEHGKVYWTEQGGNRIARANLDGSEVETVIGAGVDGPRGIKLDVPEGKIYFVDSFNEAIKRANLDGSGVETLLQFTGVNPLDISLDLSARKMYWSDNLLDQIQRANLDGSNVEVIIEDPMTGFDGMFGVGLSTGVTWLSEIPSTGTVPAGSSMDVTILVDAAGMIGGTYNASIIVASNDPDEPEVTASVTLDVTGAPDISLSQDSLDFGEAFVGFPDSLPLVIRNVGTDLLTVTNIASNNPDFTVNVTGFSLNPGESREVQVFFTPSATGLSTGTLSITSDDPDEPVVTVALQGEGILPPDIAVTPDSLSDSLFTGQTSTQIMTISNTGFSDLTFEIFVEEATSGAASVKIRPHPVSEAHWQVARSKAFSPEQRSLPHNPSGGLKPSRWGSNPYEKVPAAVGTTTSTPIPYRGDLFSPSQRGALFNIDAFAGTVSELDPTTGNVINSFPLPEPPSAGPDGLAFDGTYLYYVNGFGTNTFYRLDRTTGQVVGTAVIPGLEAIDALGHSGQALYALGFNTGTIYEIDFDAATITNQFSPAPIVGGLTFGGSRRTIFVTEGFSAIIHEIDPATGTILNTFNTPNFGDVLGLGYSNGLGILFASNTTDGMLYALNPDDGAILFSYPIPLGSGIAADEAIGITWLAINPGSGTIPAGQSLDVQVTFVATDLFGGDYRANIRIFSNDPDEPEVIVPAHLHVTGAPDIAVSPDTLDFGEVFVGFPDSLPLVIRNVGTDLLTVTNIASNNPDFTVNVTGFSLNPGESREVQVFFTPSATGLSTGTLSITSDDPDEPVVTVALQGEGILPPDIAVTPDSLSDSLFTGQTSTQIMTISNTGFSDLTFEIFLEEATSSAIPAIPRRQRSAPDGEHSPKIAKRSTKSSRPPQRATVSPEMRRKWQALSKTGSHHPLPIQTNRLSNPSPSQLPVVIEDPAGDALFVDVTLVRGASTATELQIEIEFATVIDPSDFGGFFSMDIDQDSTTGLPPSFGDPDQDIGAEYEFTFFDIDLGIVNLFDINGNFIASYPVTVEPHRLSFAAPLADIGNDDGRMDVTGVVGNNSGPTDWFPDAGHGTIGGIGWLTVNPSSGTIAAGTSQDIQVTFDATDLFGGNYQANIRISSNDPDEPEVIVPAHLHVTGAPNIAVSPDSLVFDTVFVGVSRTDTLRITNSGTDTLRVSDITSSDTAFSVDRTALNIAPQEEDVVVVTFAPGTAGSISAQLSIISNDPDQGVLNVPVHGVGAFPPSVLVHPDSISAEVQEGDSTTATLVVGNSGAGDLHWFIRPSNRGGLTVNADFIRRLTRRLQALGAEDVHGEGARVFYRVQGTITQDGSIQSFEFSNTVTVSRQLEGVHVLFTDTDWNVFRIELEARGAQTTVHVGTITTDLLNTVDILVINDDTDLTPGEINTVRAWMNTGGGVIIDADNDIADFNALIGGSGITYLPGGGTSGMTTDITPHPVTQNINRYLVALGGDAQASLSVTGDALDVIRDRTGVPHIAVAGLGRGLLVALADESINDAGISRIGHLEVGLNSVAWLGAPPWLSVSPTSGTVLPGDSAEVTVELNAATLTQGTYEAFLRVLSDDPFNPVVIVPVHLEVGPVGIGDPFANRIPENYVLMQNFPNPFNPVTYIRYGLPRASAVRIELYNILGQRVATLLDTRKPAGYHLLRFDARNYASGVYFYRIEAGDFQAVKKMLIMK